MSGQLGYDQENGRLFFSDGKDLDIVNASDGQRVGLASKIRRASDIAFAPDIHRAFIADSDSRALFAMDLSTLTVVQKINVGAESWSVLYDPDTKKVFTTGVSSSTCKVFDAGAGKQIGSVKLHGYPLRAASDSHGHIYFNLASTNPGTPLLEAPGVLVTPTPLPLKSDLAELDTRTLFMGNRWNEPSCAFLSLMGIDQSGQDLVLGCQNSVKLMDRQTRKIVASAAITGVRPVASLIFSSSLGDVFLLGLDEQPDSHRRKMVIVHEDSSGHLGPAMLAPQLLVLPGAFDGAKQQFFTLQSETTTVDTGLFMQVPGGQMTHLRVPRPIPGTFRIVVYSRN